MSAVFNDISNIPLPATNQRSFHYNFELSRQERRKQFKEIAESKPKLNPSPIGQPNREARRDKQGHYYQRKEVL